LILLNILSSFQLNPVVWSNHFIHTCLWSLDFKHVSILMILLKRLIPAKVLLEFLIIYNFIIKIWCYRFDVTKVSSWKLRFSFVIFNKVSNFLNGVMNVNTFLLWVRHASNNDFAISAFILMERTSHGKILVLRWTLSSRFLLKSWLKTFLSIITHIFIVNYFISFV